MRVRGEREITWGIAGERERERRERGGRDVLWLLKKEQNNKTWERRKMRENRSALSQCWGTGWNQMGNTCCEAHTEWVWVEPNDDDLLTPDTWMTPFLFTSSPPVIRSWKNIYLNFITIKPVEFWVSESLKNFAASPFNQCCNFTRMLHSSHMGEGVNKSYL